jgi:TonB family protein
MKLPCVVLLLTAVALASAAESPPNGAPVPPARFAFKPLVEDYYPPTSIVLKEEGTVKVRLCHNETGRVQVVTLEQSSGLRRLDDAALRMGRQYRFIPRVTNGQWQPDCVVVPVKFSLQPSQEPPDRGEGLPLAPPPPNPPPRLIPLFSETSGRNTAALTGS